MTYKEILEYSKELNKEVSIPDYLLEKNILDQNQKRILLKVKMKHLKIGNQIKLDKAE